jgi:hypothetical protein
MFGRRLASLGLALALLVPITAYAAPNDASREKSSSDEFSAADDTVSDSPQLRTIVVEKPQAPRGISRYEDSAPASGRQSPEDKSDWYGWQTLAVDVPAFVTLLVLVANDKPTPVYLGLGTYSVAAPIIHVAHGEVGNGIGSLALRVVTAPLGVLAYNGFSGARKTCDQPSNEPSNCGYGIMVAGGVGFLVLSVMGGVIAIDAAAIARPDASRKSRKAAATEYVPNLVLRHDAAMVTWGGAF